MKVGDLKFTIDRSSCLWVFCKKVGLKSFAKLTRKHVCRNLFFNEVASLGLQFVSRKKLRHRYFLMNFAIVLSTPFLTPTDECDWTERSPKMGSRMDSFVVDFLKICVFMFAILFLLTTMWCGFSEKLNVYVCIIIFTCNK